MLKLTSKEKITNTSYPTSIKEMDQETKNSTMPHHFSLPSLKTSGNNLASWDTENEAGSDTKMSFLLTSFHSAKSHNAWCCRRKVTMVLVSVPTCCSSGLPSKMCALAQQEHKGYKDNQLI